MNNARILKSFFVSLILLSTSATASAADVGVSVSIGQPGFYGRIDIGDYPYPPPRVVYSRPVIIERHVEVYEPLYLRVPPGHAKNWKRYCGRYEACGRQVYFVQDSWYRNEYVPAYRERRGEYDYERDNHRGGSKHKGNGNGKGGKGNH
jgi:hypothetical protein